MQPPAPTLRHDGSRLHRPVEIRLHAFATYVNAGPEKPHPHASAGCGVQPGAKRRDASHSHPLIALCRLSLLRAPLQSASEYGAIGLTRTKAFKRTVEHFDWPGSGAEEMFRYNKVIDEYEFPLTKRGLELVQATAQLFATLVPFYHETQRNLSESMSISGNCF